MTDSTHPKTYTQQILKIMLILTWIGFIGLMIEAGAILFVYVVSMVYPASASHLYQGLNLEPLRHFSLWEYTYYSSCLIMLAVMKAIVLYLVIKVMSDVNLLNPFSVAVAKRMEQISYILLATWGVGLLHNDQVHSILKDSGIVLEQWSASEFFFMAGIVFIIAQIFKRGVEIQAENDLTV